MMDFVFVGFTMMDLVFAAFILSCAGLLFIFIRMMTRLERLERWLHEEPDVRKKAPR